MKTIILVFSMMVLNSANSQIHNIPFRIETGSNLMVVTARINNAINQEFYWDIVLPIFSTTFSLFLVDFKKIMIIQI